MSRKSQSIAAACLLLVTGVLFWHFNSQSSRLESSFVWRPASPENEGMERLKLEALQENLAARGTHAFLIVRHDRIVYEWYAADYGPSLRHHTASLAKALVAGTALLVALNDERLLLDDPAWKYIPAWKDDPVKSLITIRHLATHSSGMHSATTPGKSLEEVGGWKTDFWEGEDPFSVALGRAPILFIPGTQYSYSGPGYAALAYAITASLQGTSYSDIRTLVKERIMDPIGIPESDWSIGYGKLYSLDGLRLYAIWGGGGYTARASARVGQLMLHRGAWEDRQLVDPLLVDTVVSYAGTPVPDRSSGDPAPGAALGWWSNFDGIWPSVPRDAFVGVGAGHQVLLVVPSLDLVVVRNGDWLVDSSRDERYWLALEMYLFNPLMEAIIRSPYRPDPVAES